MNHHVVTVAILLAALSLYGVGASSGASILLFAAASLEFWFWARILRPGKPRKVSSAR